MDMKMKRELVISAMVCVAAWGLMSVLAQEPTGIPVLFRMAIAQDSTGDYAWSFGDSPIWIDQENSILPAGFQVVEDGTSLIFTVRTTVPGIYEAIITVNSETAPGGLADWTGPMVFKTQTAKVVVVVFRTSQEDFLHGPGDVVMDSVPNPLPGT